VHGHKPHISCGHRGYGRCRAHIGGHERHASGQRACRMQLTCMHRFCMHGALIDCAIACSLHFELYTSLVGAQTRAPARTAAHLLAPTMPTNSHTSVDHNTHEEVVHTVRAHNRAATPRAQPRHRNSLRVHWRCWLQNELGPPHPSEHPCSSGSHAHDGCHCCVGHRSNVVGDLWSHGIHCMSKLALLDDKGTV